MEKVFGTILVIFLGFWLFGLIGRTFLKFWLLKKQRQMEDQMRNGGSTGSSGTFGSGNFRGFYNFGTNNENQRNEAKQKPEGEVTIEQQSQPKKGVNDSIGEYVDFEEVKE